MELFILRLLVITLGTIIVALVAQNNRLQSRLRSYGRRHKAQSIIIEGLYSIVRNGKPFNNEQIANVKCTLKELISHYFDIPRQ